jgi:hypothetical protein
VTYLPFFKSIILRVLIVFSLFLSLSATAQRHLYLGWQTGGINYQGEMQDISFSFTGMHLSMGGGLLLQLDDHWAVSSEFIRGNLSGRDAERKGNNNNQARNLSFNTELWELSAQLRYRLYPGDLVPVMPYGFAGLALFHIDPWALDANGVKHKLYPLSTEGQGLPQYPERKPHRTDRVSIPFGSGLEFRLGEWFRLDVETMFRKTFTDDIDDVSYNYPDAALLLAARGLKSVELSYRGDEVPGGIQTFPAAGTQRGNPLRADWYHSFNVRLRVELHDWRRARLERNAERKVRCGR